MYYDEVILYVGQSCELRLDTHTDLNGAENQQILFQRPDFSYGSWLAVIDETELVYQTLPADFNVPGLWRFQTYAEKGGLVMLGEILVQEIKPSLMIPVALFKHTA